MTHPDWPAFLAAIVADPGDDTVRLVAADFLDENGHADRAAFIRVQVALARLEASGSGDSPEANDLRKRERAFLGPKSVYPHLWAAVECPELVRMPGSGRTGSPLAHLRVVGVERLTWQRGFVGGVRCPAAEWLRHGAAVRARNPVRWVVLTECGALERDAWYAGLAALRGLSRIICYGGNDQCEWLREWLPGTHLEWFPF